MSSKSAQPYLQLIDDRALTMSAASQLYTLTLKEKLRHMIRGDMVSHVAGLLIEHVVTPVFTTAPTTQLQVGQFCARRITVKAEKGRNRFDVSENDIRALEVFENQGRLVFPDPDLNSGTGNLFCLSRFVSFAPGHAPDSKDFAIPACLLTLGTVDFQSGVITDFSADTTTASTVRTLVYAVLYALPHINIPPYTEVRFFNGSGNNLVFADLALIPSLIMLNSANHDAIAVGAFANITCSDRKGEIIPATPAPVIGRVFNAMMAPGQFGLIQGEPRSATDDNLKQVNGTTPTALVSPLAAYQPVLFSPEGTDVDEVEAEFPGELRWSGSQATSYVVMRRILPRPREDVESLIREAVTILGVPVKDSFFRKQNGQRYVGTKAEYQPARVLIR